MGTGTISRPQKGGLARFCFLVLIDRTRSSKLQAVRTGKSSVPAETALRPLSERPAVTSLSGCLGWPAGCTEGPPAGPWGRQGWAGPGGRARAFPWKCSEGQCVLFP